MLKIPYLVIFTFLSMGSDNAFFKGTTYFYDTVLLRRKVRE